MNNKRFYETALRRIGERYVRDYCGVPHDGKTAVRVNKNGFYPPYDIYAAPILNTDRDEITVGKIWLADQVHKLVKND